MELKFIGKGAAFYPTYGNTGAYIKNGNDLYLLDCGATAFDVIHERVNLDKVEDVYVLLTHLHADHVGSLGTLISYFYCEKQKTIHVIHPNANVMQLLELEGIEAGSYLYHERLPVNSAGLVAEPVEVKHVDNMVCYGYLLSDAENMVYYSGDASDVPENVLEMFLDGRIGCMYQDTSTHDALNPTHCYYGKLERLIPWESRSRVYCMHLDSPCDVLLQEKGFRIVEVEGK